MSSNKIEISVKDIPEIIKTLEEAEKEIEFERKSKNLFIDDLYKVCEISLKQDKEIERLNNIINGLEKELEKDFHTFMCNNREVGKTYKAGGNAYREHILLRLQELKGSNEPSFEEMVGFVENVCKDIKSQPTLHEELEEERKTIAKIVDDFKEVNK